MDQQASRGHDDATRLGDRLFTPIGIAVAALLLGLVIGFVFAQGRSHMHEANVACMSAVGAISCGPLDSPGQGEYGVPLDVAWTKDGVFHSDGRPDCLPPTGRGTVQVQVTWTEVETGGTSWKQVVGVHC
ncbi:hypothetical protein OG984_00495 [Nocardioides sp. NBC_00368]|uniref:hypothetical protein n=1 Tax=Nocardioides sp. NBC_00368 TaxID=2976000 RepID=UPI002E21C0DB